MNDKIFLNNGDINLSLLLKNYNNKELNKILNKFIFNQLLNENFNTFSLPE